MKGARKAGLPLQLVELGLITEEQYQEYKVCKRKENKGLKHTTTDGEEFAKKIVIGTSNRVRAGMSIIDAYAKAVLAVNTYESVSFPMQVLTPDEYTEYKSGSDKSNKGLTYTMTESEKVITSKYRFFYDRKCKGFSIEETRVLYEEKMEKGKPITFKIFTPEEHQDYRDCFKNRRKGIETTEAQETAEKKYGIISSYYSRGNTLQEAIEFYEDGLEKRSVIDSIGDIKGEYVSDLIRSAIRKGRSKCLQQRTDDEQYWHDIYMTIINRMAKGMVIEEAIESAIEDKAKKSYAEKIFPDVDERNRFKKAYKKYSNGGKSACNKDEGDLVAKYVNEVHLLRLESDVMYALKKKLRGVVSNGFRNGFKKDSPTAEILGCDFETAIAHVESTNWELNINDGQNVNIDHIIPASKAETEEEAIILNHHLNFQLLESDINQHVKKANWPTFHIDSEVVSHKNSYVLMVISYFNYSRYAQYHDADFNITVDRDKQEMKIEQWSEMAA